MTFYIKNIAYFSIFFITLNVINYFIDNWSFWSFSILTIFTYYTFAFAWIIRVIWIDDLCCYGVVFAWV